MNASSSVAPAGTMSMSSPAAPPMGMGMTASPYPAAVTYPSAVSASSYPSPGGLYNSVIAGRVYSPPNAEYVAPGQPLKGGMYPIYDTAAVPTFEAPIAFATAPTTSPNMALYDTAESMGVMARDGRRGGAGDLTDGGFDNNSTARIRVPSQNRRRKGCCAC